MIDTRDIRRRCAKLRGYPDEEDLLLLARTQARKHRSARDVALVWWNASDVFPWEYVPETGSFHRAGDYLKDLIYPEPSSETLEFWVLDEAAAAALVLGRLGAGNYRYTPAALDRRREDPDAIPVERVIPALRSRGAVD